MADGIQDYAELIDSLPLGEPEKKKRDEMTGLQVLKTRHLREIETYESTLEKHFSEFKVFISTYAADPEHASQKLTVTSKCVLEDCLAFFEFKRILKKKGYLFSETRGLPEKYLIFRFFR